MGVFFTVFQHGGFLEVRILRIGVCLKSLKSRQKQGIDLQLFEIFRAMRRAFHFSQGIGNSVESLQRKIAAKNIPEKTANWQV